jgi:hypothetical protein
VFILLPIFELFRVIGMRSPKSEINQQQHTGPHTTEHQYNETNVMHFLFNVLKVKGLYMFRALLAHPQEALHKWHLALNLQYIE